MPPPETSGTDTPAAVSQDDMRRLMIDAISAYSGARWCAGWLVGIEGIVRREGGAWVVLAYLAGGWPLGLDGEEGWLGLTEEEATVARAYLTSVAAGAQSSNGAGGR